MVSHLDNCGEKLGLWQEWGVSHIPHVYGGTHDTLLHNRVKTLSLDAD